MLFTFRYTFVADHYQYLACIGPIALASAGIVSLSGQICAVPRRHCKRCVVSRCKLGDVDVAASLDVHRY